MSEKERQRERQLEGMADILLSALVSSMVRNLNTSALQELGVALGLRAELDNLESTLTTIQAVLQDAEEKQWKSEAIRNWLIKLKEEAYDAEDVLDEFATEDLIQKAEKEKGVKSQVSSFFSLQNRLIFRIKMAHKLKNVRDRLESISMERSKFHLRELDINMEVFDIERRQTGSLVNESEIYGRGKEKKKSFKYCSLICLIKIILPFMPYGAWGAWEKQHLHS